MTANTKAGIATGIVVLFFGMLILSAIFMPPVFAFLMETIFIFIIGVLIALITFGTFLLFKDLFDDFGD